MSWINGKPWSEVINGTFDDDTVYANGGDDYVFGYGGADHIYGQSGNDTLYGYSGDDLLVGGTGGDTLYGDEGTDTVSYSLSSGGVTINLDIGYAHGGDAQGDTIYSVENVTGSDFKDYLIGDDAGNVFQGMMGDDHLDGMKGNDGLFGGLGKDHLFGGQGFDAIHGGAGQDFLSGGSERDVFRFDFVSDSGRGANNRDTIMDWGVGGVTDRIDLSGIDSTSAPGDQAFNLVEGAFTDVAQVRVVHNNGNTYVQANTAGDLIPEFVLELIGNQELSTFDFIL